MIVAMPRLRQAVEAVLNRRRKSSEEAGRNQSFVPEGVRLTDGVGRAGGHAGDADADAGWRGAGEDGAVAGVTGRGAVVGVGGCGGGGGGGAGRGGGGGGGGGRGGRGRGLPGWEQRG
jgi:hypothetical protein